MLGCVSSSASDPAQSLEFMNTTGPSTPYARYPVSRFVMRMRIVSKKPLALTLSTCLTTCDRNKHMVGKTDYTSGDVTHSVTHLNASMLKLLCVPVHIIPVQAHHLRCEPAVRKLQSEVTSASI